MSEQNHHHHRASSLSRSRSPEEFDQQQQQEIEENEQQDNNNNNNYYDAPQLPTNSRRRSTNNNSPAQQGYVNPNALMMTMNDHHHHHQELQQQENMMKILTDPERTTLIDDESMLMSDVNQLHENLQNASYEALGWENLGKNNAQKHHHQQQQNQQQQHREENNNTNLHRPSVKTPFELSFQHQHDDDVEERNLFHNHHLHHHHNDDAPIIEHHTTQFLHDDESFHPVSSSSSTGINNNNNNNPVAKLYHLPSEENVASSSNAHHLISSMAKFMLGKEDNNQDHEKNRNYSEENVQQQQHLSPPPRHDHDNENNFTPDSSPIIHNNNSYQQPEEHQHQNYENPEGLVVADDEIEPTMRTTQNLNNQQQDLYLHQILDAIETDPRIKEHLLQQYSVQKATAEQNSNPLEKQQRQQQEQQIQSVRNFEHFMDTQFDSSKFSHQDAAFFTALQKRLKELKSGLWGGNELLEYVGMRENDRKSNSSKTNYDDLVEYSTSMQRERSRQRAEQPFSFSVAAAANHHHPPTSTSSSHHHQKSRAQIEKEDYEKRKQQQLDEEFYTYQYPSQHRGTYFSAVSDIQQSLHESRQKLHHSFESVFRQQQEREFRLEKLKNDLSQYLTSKYGVSSSQVEGEKPKRVMISRSELTLHEILNESSGNRNKFQQDEKNSSSPPKIAAPFVNVAAAIAHEKRTLYRRFLTPSFQEAVLQDWNKKQQQQQPKGGKK